jgi:hypothetical protein
MFLNLHGSGSTFCHLHIRSIRLIYSSAFGDTFLDILQLDQIFFDLPICLIPSISCSTFRDPILDIPWASLMLRSLPAAGSTCINLPSSSYLLDSLDFFSDVQEGVSHPRSIFPTFLDLLIRRIRTIYVIRSDRSFTKLQ